MQFCLWVLHGATIPKAATNTMFRAIDILPDHVDARVQPLVRRVSESLRADHEGVTAG
ncbi:protein of unknown function [Bradyrhizobium vignae]|uniref:Uncharacterized protein n=1 Tax=Bradyrhizobium vignae TaxID=1549949 RepID=A0A2U3Q9Y3_9BRAD|nr:protein of unknown function [Bradyrhizobium vignae]